MPRGNKYLPQISTLHRNWEISGKNFFFLPKNLHLIHWNDHENSTIWTGSIKSPVQWHSVNFWICVLEKRLIHSSPESSFWIVDSVVCCTWQHILEEIWRNIVQRVNMNNFSSYFPIQTLVFEKMLANDVICLTLNRQSYNLYNI
jgi:hypothetical protein